MQLHKDLIPREIGYNIHLQHVVTGRKQICTLAELKALDLFP
jgi:hypothetical protein